MLTAFKTVREAERRQLELELLTRDAELRTLRAQIDPHFRYNSLNSISALTTSDAPGARRMCLLLGEFLATRWTCACASLEGGVIRLDIARQNERLTIVIENPCDADVAVSRAGGMGLANVRGRLEAMFGREASMDTRVDAGQFRVELHLPVIT